MGVLLAFPVKKKLIGLLVTILLRYQIIVTDLVYLAKTYGSPYFQSGNLLHMLGPVDQSYDEADLYYNKLHAVTILLRYQIIVIDLVYLAKTYGSSWTG
jgi:hypothetical protein